MRSRFGSLATAGLFVALVFTQPQRALAGGELLKHSMWGLIATPLELLVSPVTAGSTLATNMEVAGYNTQTRIALGPPGFLWLWMSQIGMGAGRGMAAAAELPIALVTLPTPLNPAPLVDFDNEPAMVEHPTQPFRFGIYFARRE